MAHNIYGSRTGLGPFTPSTAPPPPFSTVLYQHTEGHVDLAQHAGIKMAPLKEKNTQKGALPIALGLAGTYAPNARHMQGIIVPTWVGFQMELIPCKRCLDTKFQSSRNVAFIH